MKIYKIGFELECEAGENLLHDMNELGSTAHDGSLARCDSNRDGFRCDRLSLVEFRSTPYVRLSSYDEFFDALDKAYEKKQYHWNDTMGFHIHVSFTNDDGSRCLKPQALISPAFVRLFNEELKKQFPDVYTVRGNNHYCRISPSKAILNNVLSTDRYQAVNFTSLQVHRTIEFRVFPADEPARLREYLAWTYAFVKNAIATMDNTTHATLRSVMNGRIPFRDVGTEKIGENLDIQHNATIRTMNRMRNSFVRGDGISTYVDVDPVYRVHTRNRLYVQYKPVFVMVMSRRVRGTIRAIPTIHAKPRKVSISTI